MTSISLKKPSSFPQIPQEVLKKAAESALVSSFVELNSCSRKQSISSSNSNRTNSSQSSSLLHKKPTSHKVVIDVDTKSSSSSSSNETSTASNKTTVFIKVTPKNSPAFPDALREIQIHEEFLKELNQTNKALLFRNDRPPTLGFIPICFLTQISEDNCMIFLENLKAQDYQKCPSLLLDFNHALLAVETLARFHSSSYYTRKQLGVKGKGSLELLRKFPYVKGPSRLTEEMKRKAREVYGKFFDKIICKIVEGENPSLAFKLRRKFKEPELIWDKMEALLENEKYENDDFYVACHGDFRSGNLMFKYAGEGRTGGDPEECRMVDLKSLQWGPIASDLAYFFFTSTSGKTREEFEEKLLAFYCDSFEEQLKSRYETNGGQGDFDIEDFHRKLESQYRRMLEYGFYRGITALPLFMIGNGNTMAWGLEEVWEMIDRSQEEFDNFVADCLKCKDLNRAVVGIVVQLVKNRIV